MVDDAPPLLLLELLLNWLLGISATKHPFQEPAGLTGLTTEEWQLCYCY